MERRVFFEDARKNVLELFSVEFPSLQIPDIDLFISNFYKWVNYEEEGQKIRPTIIITSNINAVAKNVPGSKKIIFYEDADTSNFKAHTKALMVFCKSNWYIYMSFTDNGVEYGIIKGLTSIKEKSLIQTLTQKETLDSIAKRTNLVILSVVGGGVIKLQGARGNTVSICFNLNSGNEYNWENEIYEFVEACVSKIKTTPRKLQDIRNLLFNTFQRCLKDLHGTICLVVDKEFKDKNGFLADGTWLKEPIEFAKLFMRSNKFDENVLRSYADVFTTMLDFDGITIIDNAGRIRAYNVFIESNNTEKIVGGARKRAAYSLLQSKLKRIVGVYFQSQDGDNFYKEKSDLKKKKKKIKIVDGQVINENNDMLPLEVIASLQQQQKKEDEKELDRLAKEKEKLAKEKEKLAKEKEKLASAKEELEAKQENLKQVEQEKIEKEKQEEVKNLAEEMFEEVDNPIEIELAETDSQNLNDTTNKDESVDTIETGENETPQDSDDFEN